MMKCSISHHNIHHYENGQSFVLDAFSSCMLYNRNNASQLVECTPEHGDQSSAFAVIIQAVDYSPMVFQHFDSTLPYGQSKPPQNDS